ncbi:porin [Marinobacter sp. NSM]|uniref:porin n=1 Tax=Marinobacter sp. NSM TaxID=3458004 RepID=UPI0040371DC2
MKKTILASAIAAATFSGAALAQESNLPTVYGNIQYAISHENVDGAGSKIEHFDNGSTLGVVHDHEIAPGITGFFKLELDGFDADDKDKETSATLDEAYIGVKGDSFGQLWVGSDDSIYESAVDEIGEFYEIGSDISNNYSTGEGDLVQYLSPSFGGLTLGAAVQVNGDNDTKGTGKKSYPYQLAAMYNVDALELAFAVDSNDNGDGNNENSYGLRASYNLDNLRLTGQFETRKDIADTFGVMGVYTLGANQFALSYQLRDLDSGDKNDTITLQALHNLSDHMYVYFEGYLSNADEEIYDIAGEPGAGDEKSIAAIGAVYYF